MQVEQFIHSHLESVDLLRALLLLHGDPQTGWKAVDVATRLYLQPGMARPLLESLEARGLAASRGDPPLYFYQPRSAEMAALVEQVVTLDRERPVTLLNIVYARPRDIQAFSDAFRLRKEKE